MQNQTNQLPWNELLRKEREQRSWTQAEVAEKLGVDVKTVGRWESGERFPMPLHRRGLSKIFEKPLPELGLAEEPPSNKSIPVSTQVGEKPTEEGNGSRDVTSVAAGETQPNNHSSPDQANVSTYNPVPAPTLAQSQTPLSPRTAVLTPAITSPQHQQLWRRLPILIAGIGLLVLVAVVLALVLHIAFSPKTGLSSHHPTNSQASTTPPQSPASPVSACSVDNNEVALYTGPNYQGICRSFAPGQYDLSRLGFQNVHSLKDPNGAYHITLIDRFGRRGYFENDTPQLPLQLDGQVSSLLVEPYPPTSCTPASNGIIGYVEVNYQGGCLSITQSISDLGMIPFDHVISSLRFVGNFSNTRQLVIYRQPNYQDECGRYSQDQPDLSTCAGQAASVRVLPYTPPIPTPTPTPVATATPGVTPTPAVTCPQDTSGVTLFVDPNYQGHCHTFPPGDYDLAQYGLDQNVSSLRDPNAAFHVTLVDRSGRPGYFDADQPQLPADWNDQAHSLRVEKHRPTSCTPGSNGIIAYIDRSYQAGCLFITGNIADLTPLNFDHVISSLRFVGSYLNTTQLVIYQQPNYQNRCGAYSQDNPDLMNCSDQAVSVQVLPYTPPTPTPRPINRRWAR